MVVLVTGSSVPPSTLLFIVISCYTKHEAPELYDASDDVLFWSLVNHRRMMSVGLSAEGGGNDHKRLFLSRFLSRRFIIIILA